MQYNHYPSSAHQVNPASHPSQSPDEYTSSSSYADASHHHSAVSYAAVNQATRIPTGSIGHQNLTTQYPYSPYATQSSPDDHRSYYATPPQGIATEHYAPPGSPTSSYAPPNHSGQLSGQPPRHHVHLSHHQQQQQQFIPTPSEAYRVYSSPGSAASARSRPTVEPYYHMSPNPQHAVHAPSASTTHGRSSTSSGSSHPHHAHGHTGTIVVTAGERYPCELCDRSFTRLHDRRRHYETVHATSPVLHKCRYCRKDFSRADSLKRHVDNGCEEMPR